MKWNVDRKFNFGEIANFQDPRPPANIRPSELTYAASDPAECFAVLSEYFFSAPELFAPRFPSLWQRFCQFYQQDPLQRLHRTNDTDSFSTTNVH